MENQKKKRNKQMEQIPNKVSRGIRNNNPGNIRHAYGKDDKCDWQGLDSTKEGNDKDFCTFKTMGYGCRALIKTLQTYVKKHRCMSIAQVVCRWAPSNENDTESYIYSVSSFCHYGAQSKLDFKKRPDLWLNIARAIARHENGDDIKYITEEDWKFACSQCNVTYSSYE